jgi:hypothetical protein
LHDGLAAAVPVRVATILSGRRQIGCRAASGRELAEQTEACLQPAFVHVHSGLASIPAARWPYPIRLAKSLFQSCLRFPPLQPPYHPRPSGPPGVVVGADDPRLRHSLCCSPPWSSSSRLPSLDLIRNGQGGLCRARQPTARAWTVGRPLRDLLCQIHSLMLLDCPLLRRSQVEDSEHGHVIGECKMAHDQGAHLLCLLCAD